MKKVSIVITLVLARLAHAQATVNFQPPVPPSAPILGQVTATASAQLQCVVVGNAVPATAITVSCPHLGPTAIPAYTIPLIANAAYTFDQHFNGDAISFIIQSSAAGLISWQAVATPNGGTAVSANGNF